LPMTSKGQQVAHVVYSAVVPVAKERQVPKFQKNTSMPVEAPEERQDNATSTVLDAIVVNHPPVAVTVGHGNPVSDVTPVVVTAGFNDIEPDKPDFTQIQPFNPGFKHVHMKRNHIAVKKKLKSNMCLHARAKTVMQRNVAICVGT